MGEGAASGPLLQSLRDTRGLLTRQGDIPCVAKLLRGIRLSGGLATGYAWLSEASVLDSANATTGIQARINSCIN